MDPSQMANLKEVIIGKEFRIHNVRRETWSGNNPEKR